MSQTPPYLRCQELMNRDDTALVVVDVQEKLTPLIPQFNRIAFNLGRLIDAAKILGVPVCGTEQYPKGLGATVSEVAERTGPLTSKITFSCWACDKFREELVALDKPKVLLAGIEAHVCVQQTAFDLMAAGFRVYLAVDAIGARFDIDRDVALKRLQASGASLVTTESAIFEWCYTAEAAEFKQLSQLIRQTQKA